MGNGAGEGEKSRRENADDEDREGGSGLLDGLGLDKDHNLAGQCKAGLDLFFEHVRLDVSFLSQLFG